MKLSWSKGASVICAGKIFHDGWGVIVWMKSMEKPWIWKVTTK